MRSPRPSPEAPGFHTERDLLISIVTPWNLRWLSTTGDPKDLISLVSLGAHLVAWAASQGLIPDPGFIGGARAGRFLEPIMAGHEKQIRAEAKAYVKRLADARRPVWEAEQREAARVKAESDVKGSAK